MKPAAGKREKYSQEITRLQQRISELESEVARWEQNQQSSELFQHELPKILEFMSDGVDVRGMDGKVIAVNESAVKLFGFKSKDEMIGRIGVELIAPDDRPRARQNHQILLKQGYLTSIEYTFLRADGSEFIGERSAGGILDECQNTVGFISVTRDVTEHKRTYLELKQSQEQLRNLSAHLELRMEEQRKVLAREIHDELGQALTALNMDVSWLAQKFPGQSQAVVNKLNAMKKLIDETAETVSRISYELRPSMLDDLGLAAAMQWQLEEFQKRTGIKYKLVNKVDEDGINIGLKTTLFRLFQESLTNIARHSHATRMTVMLQIIENQIYLTINDNGRGMTEEQVSSPLSFGLIGMRERALHWRGNVTIDSLPGKGTRVNVVMPLHEEELSDEKGAGY